MSLVTGFVVEVAARAASTTAPSPQVRRRPGYFPDKSGPSEYLEPASASIVTSSGSVQVATLKTSHDVKAHILWLYETAGRIATARISGLSTAASVYETNVIEEPLRRLQIGSDQIELAFTPWRVRTIRIER